MNLNEYESMKTSIYNLSLYLSYIEKHHPILFRKLNRMFDGLPSYSACRKDS